MPFYQISPFGKQDLSDLPGTDTPTSPHPKETRRALAYLHDRGAHFVLLADKKPLWKGYLKRRPALETVLHSPELGIVPWSLRNTVLDVDRGEPVQLCLFHPPLVVLASGQADHCHLYYRDTEPRRNGNWTAFGCGGQIRGANGFLRLWHPQSSVKLLFALAHNPNPCMFPADLFQAPPAKKHRPPADPGEPYTRDLASPDIDLGKSRPATATTACSTWFASGPTPRRSQPACTTGMNGCGSMLRHATSSSVSRCPSRRWTSWRCRFRRGYGAAAVRGIIGRGHLSRGVAVALPGDVCGDMTPRRGMRRLCGWSETG